MLCGSRKVLVVPSLDSSACTYILQTCVMGPHTNYTTFSVVYTFRDPSSV